jgi:hypothetical protein
LRLDEGAAQIELDLTRREVIVLVYRATCVDGAANGRSRRRGGPARSQIILPISSPLHHRAMDVNPTGGFETEGSFCQSPSGAMAEHRSGGSHWPRAQWSRGGRKYRKARILQSNACAGVNRRAFLRPTQEKDGAERGIRTQAALCHSPRLLAPALAESGQRATHWLCCGNGAPFRQAHRGR